SHHLGSVRILYLPPFPTRRSSDLGGHEPASGERTLLFVVLSHVWPSCLRDEEADERAGSGDDDDATKRQADLADVLAALAAARLDRHESAGGEQAEDADRQGEDRKSTRLNSSHVKISYAVF